LQHHVGKPSITLVMWDLGPVIFKQNVHLLHFVFIFFSFKIILYIESFILDHFNGCTKQVPYVDVICRVFAWHPSSTQHYVLYWTIAFDPTFGSFTLLELVSHYMNLFFWWKCLDSLDWNGFFLVFRVWIQ